MAGVNILSIFTVIFKTRIPYINKYIGHLTVTIVYPILGHIANQQV